MKKLHLGAIRRQVFSCLKAYPIETLLGCCFFLMYIIENSLSYPVNQPWKCMPFFFPTLFVVTYCCNNLFKDGKRFGYYLSIITLIPLMLLSEYLDAFIDSTAFGFTLLLTAFLLLGYRKTADNTSFARHCVKLVVNVAFSFVIGMLLMGMIAALYFSIVYIFDCVTYGKFVEDMFHFTMYLFVPLYFCRLQQDAESDWETLPKIVQFVLNFILSPGIIAYTVILYVYFIMIAIRWELPKGGVAYMVMAFIIVTLAGRMSQLIVAKKHYEWFYHPFSFIAIPPLILFWIGSIHRIYTYGLTESRVYLLVAGVSMTLYVFFLLNKRLSNYRLMLLVNSAVIVLFTYIPGISARSIGIAAQAHRMERLASEILLWDVVKDRLTGTENFLIKDSIQLEIANQVSASYRYLENEQGKAKAKSLYGDNLLNMISKDVEVVFYNCPDHDIPISGYNRYLPDCHVNYCGDDSLEVKQADRLLLKISVKSHFIKYEKEINLWNKQATELAPFCFQNDSCLVIVRHIKKDEKGKLIIEKHNEPLVFCK